MTSSPVELKTCDSPVSLQQTPSAPKFSPLWITIDKATSTLLSFKLKTHHHSGVSAAQRRKRFRTLLSMFYLEDSSFGPDRSWIGLSGKVRPHAEGTATTKWAPMDVFTKVACTVYYVCITYCIITPNTWYVMPHCLEATSCTHSKVKQPLANSTD